MEAVKIRQTGYPLRAEYAEFGKTYGCIITVKFRHELEAKCGAGNLWTAAGAALLADALPAYLNDETLKGKMLV